MVFGKIRRQPSPGSARDVRSGPSNPPQTTSPCPPPAERAVPAHNRTDLMPPADSQLTLDLFGNAAPAFGRTLHAPRAALGPADAPTVAHGGKQPFDHSRSNATAGRRQLLSCRGSAAGGELARLRARQHRRDPAVTRIEKEGRAHPVHRFRRELARQQLLPSHSEDGFRAGWQDIARDLQNAVDTAAYASLSRSTQYAHYTPDARWSTSGSAADGSSSLAWVPAYSSPCRPDRCAIARTSRESNMTQ
jgi:hypothetical protein